MPPHRNASSAEDDSFFREIDSLLWPVFVYAAIHNYARRDLLCHMSSNHFVKLLRPFATSSGDDFLSVAGVSVIWHAEAQKHNKKFPFSAFKRALGVVSHRLDPDAPSPTKAFVSFLDDFVETATRQGMVHERKSIEECTVPVALFPILYDFFSCYSSMPTSYEIDVLGRHAARHDVSAGRQSLAVPGWTAFASDFRLTERLSSVLLAQIFVDSCRVAAVDDLGGLTREEFAEAFLRAALALAGKKENRRILVGLRILREHLQHHLSIKQPPSLDPSTATSKSLVESHSSSFSRSKNMRANYHVFIKAARAFSNLVDELADSYTATALSRNTSA